MAQGPTGSGSRGYGQMHTHLVLLDAVDVPNGPANSGNEALHAWDDVPVRVGIGEGMDVMGIWGSMVACAWYRCGCALAMHVHGVG